jgi:hypothetical protein
MTLVGDKDCMNVEGVAINFETAIIPIGQIELDVENPRIGYYTDNASILSDSVSQKEVVRAIKSAYTEPYNQLRTNIETNGGAIVEIWVSKKGDKFLCIDGNTRVMIYKDLQLKYPNNPEWKRIKAKIFPDNISERVKDFLRLTAHLRNVNDWQVYERARMLYLLWNKKGYHDEELRNMTKLSFHEIKKWRSAYMIMNEQFLPKYSDKPDALTKFSYFVEYQNPKIISGMKKYGMDVTDFCDWVGRDEINRGQDVRLLKDIFENDSAAKTLSTRGFEAAKEELWHTKPALGSKLFEHVDECIQGFRKMQRWEEQEILSNKDTKKLEMINQLYQELAGFVRNTK